MVAEAPTQDMPPTGGYAPINFKRIPAQAYFKGWHLFAGLIAVMASGLYTWAQNYKKRKYEEIENRSTRLAILPLLTAERDRGILKQLWKNRIEEEKLMKDIPNWEVGKYYDQPLFKTIPSDTWIGPIGTDYFVHSDMDDFYDRIFFRHYHF